MLGLFALITAPYFIAKLGGLGVLLKSRQAAAASLTDTGLITGNSKSTYAIVVALATVPPFLALLALWIERSRPLRVGRTSLPTLALVLALITSNALVNNPISNPRYWVLSLVLAFVIVGRHAARPVFVRGLIVVLLLSAVVVFPYLDYFRYTNHEGGQAGPLTELIHKTDYDSMAQIQDGVLFAKERGHTDGKQMLGAGLFWDRGTSGRISPRTPVLFWRPTSTFPTPTCRHLCGLRPGWTSLGWALSESWARSDMSLVDSTCTFRPLGSRDDPQ